MAKHYFRFVFSIMAFLLFSSPFLGEKKAFSSVDEKNLFLVAQRAFEDGFYDVTLRYIHQLFRDFPNPEQYADIKLLEAQAYFLKKDYSSAIALLKDLKNQNLDQDAVLFWLAEVYLKKGDLKEAKKQYENLIENDSNSAYLPQSYYALGWVYFEEESYFKAQNLFQYLTEHFPSNPLAEDSLFKMAECAYNLGEYERAVFLFDSYLKKYPLSQREYEVFFNMAESYYYCDQYQKALSLYEKAQSLAALQDGKKASRLGQAWSLLKMNQEQEALAIFDSLLSEAQERNTMDLEALFGKASLWVHFKKYAQALQVYTQILEAPTEWTSFQRAEILLGRANVYGFLQDPASAIVDYQTVIDENQGNVFLASMVQEARFSLAQTYVQMKNFDQAKEVLKGLQREAKDEKTQFKAMMQIAEIEEDSSHLEESMQIYQKILQKVLRDDPFFDLVQYRLGVCVLKVGRLDEALDIFLSLSSNSSTREFSSGVAYYTGVAYLKKKMFDDAVQVLSVFLKPDYQKDTFSFEAQYTLALSLFHLKKYHNALDILQELIQDPSVPLDVQQMALLHRAKIQYALGQEKDALKGFKKIIDAYPQTEVEFEARLSLGQYYLSKKLFRQAEEQYLQILKEHPHQPTLFLVDFELARLYHSQGEVDKAITFYQKIQSQDHAELYIKTQMIMADIFYQSSEVTKAIALLKPLIEKQHSLIRDVYFQLAKYYRDLNETDLAKNAYERSLWADVGESTLKAEDIHFQLADFLESHQKGDAAIEEYRLIVQKYPENSDLISRSYLRMARLYEHQENWEKALNIYQKLVKMDIALSKFAQERIDAIEQEQ